MYEYLLYIVQFIYLVLNCLFIVHECLVYFVLFTIVRIAYKSCLIDYSKDLLLVHLGELS